MVHIRPVTVADADAWLRLRQGLWPDTTEAEHWAEMEPFFAGGAVEPLAVLLAWDEHGNAVGFAELSIRPYAEGCETKQVAYLEGWYVMPNYQRQGIGRLLIEAAEAWGRSQGCTEFASDAEADNEVSRLAHGAIGFEDVGLIRCFRKEL